MGKSKPEQVNMFPVDVEQVWKDFREVSNWDAQAAKQREDTLKQLIPTLRAKADKAAADLETAEKELLGLADRERKAKAHLEAAAKAMGKFASHRVLMESLLEAYPPLKPKRGRPARGTAAPRRAPAPASETVIDDVPVANEVRASMVRSFLLDNLDSDGLKVSDLLKLAPKDAGFTYGELSTVLRGMVTEGCAATVGGQGRGILYAKAVQHG